MIAKASTADRRTVASSFTDEPEISVRDSYGRTSLSCYIVDDDTVCLSFLRNSYLYSVPPNILCWDDPICCHLPVVELLFPAQALDAKRKLEKRRKSSSKVLTDDTYAGCLALRSLPYTAFLDGDAPTCPLPISSINEDKLLVAFGLPRSERYQIEDLQTIRRGSLLSSPTDRDGAQLSASALTRLAANPPAEVGALQRRTCGWLLRPCEPCRSISRPRHSHW